MTISFWHRHHSSGLRSSSSATLLRRTFFAAHPPPRRCAAASSASRTAVATSRCSLLGPSDSARCYGATAAGLTREFLFLFFFFVIVFHGLFVQARISVIVHLVFTTCIECLIVEAHFSS